MSLGFFDIKKCLSYDRGENSGTFSLKMDKDPLPTSHFIIDNS
jgi:hypothetical protein